MRRLFVIAAAAMAGFTAPAAAQDACKCVPGACVKLETATAKIEGRLIVRKGAYMVRLDRKTCFKGNGDETDIAAGEDRPGQIYVQLAPSEADVAKLKALVGRRVALTGDAFGAHTRYHLTGALLAPKEIAEAR